MKRIKNMITVSIAVVFLTAVAGNIAVAGEDQNLATAKKLVQAFNQKDISKYDEIYSSKLAYYGTGENAKLDLDGFKHFMSNIFTTFPDAKIAVDELIAKGDKVFYRVTFTGTQNGDMPGFPATGKKVKARSIGIFRFENGKIVEEWENFDEMGLMQQLGAIPISEKGHHIQ